jgi:hypothetical protein
MDPLRLLELEMRERAGLLTGPEREELASVPITIGTPPAIVLPRPCKSEADFDALARRREAQLEADPAHPFRKPSDWRPIP